MQQEGFKVIHVNYSPAAVESVYYPQVGNIGDIANSVTFGIVDSINAVVLFEHL